MVLVMTHTRGHSRLFSPLPLPTAFLALLALEGVFIARGLEPFLPSVDSRRILHKTCTLKYLAKTIRPICPKKRKGGTKGVNTVANGDRVALYQFF